MELEDDKRGPCGDADASESVQGMQNNEGGPQSQTQVLRDCFKALSTVPGM